MAQSEKVRVPVMSKLSAAPDKAWNLGVTASTTARDVVSIVCRAVNSDPSQVNLFAATREEETILQETHFVLDTWKRWQQMGAAGRFLLREQAQAAPAASQSGLDLFNRISSGERLASSPGISRPRGINTTNTFSAGSSAISPSTERVQPHSPELSPSKTRTFTNPTMENLRASPLARQSSDPAAVASASEESATKHIQMIEERIRDFQDKKTKLTALLGTYSQKLAHPLEPQMMKHYQDNISKANQGLHTIESKLRELQEEKERVQERLKKSQAAAAAQTAASATDTLLIATSEFTPVPGMEERVTFPASLSSNFTREGERSGAFKQLLTLLKRTGTPPIQEKALQVINTICQMEKNQTVVFQTELLPILLALLDAPSSTTLIQQRSTWILSTLSSIDTNRTRIVQANGIPPLLRLLFSSDDTVMDQTVGTLSNLLGARQPEILSRFRQAQGLDAIIQLFIERQDEQHRSKALKLLVLLGLPEEDRTILASREDMILGLVQTLKSSSDNVQRLTVSILASLSTLSQCHPFLYQAKAFETTSRLLRGGDPRLIEKAILIVNNLAMASSSSTHETDSERSIAPMITLMSHMDSKLKNRAICCLANLVLIDEDHLEAFYDQNGLSNIIERLQDSQPVVIEPTLRLLVNVTHESVLSDSVRNELGSMQAVALLSKLMDRKDLAPSAIEQSLKALVNISLSYLQESEYLDTELVPRLVKNFAASSPTLREYSAAILVNITRRSDKIREEVRKSNGLSAALTLCEASGPEIQIQACKLITNVALNGRSRYFFQKSSKCTTILQKLSESKSSSDLSDSASHALRNVSFPCEDYGGAVEDMNMNSDMEAMIQQAARKVAAIEAEEDDAQKPLSREQALQRVRSFTIGQARVRAAPTPEDTQLDSFLAELADEESRIEAESFALQKKEERIKRAESDLSARKSKDKEPRNQSEALDNTLDEMEALVDSLPTDNKTPRASSNDSEQQQLLDERQVLLREREQFELERKRFEEERTRLQAEKDKAKAAQEAGDAVVPDEEVAEGESSEAPPEEEEETDPEKIEKYNHKRMQIAVETLVTERSYVDSLNTMVNKYLNPMTNLCLARRPIVKKDQITEIFANVEEIINYHTMLLEGLERRVSKFDGNTCLGEFFISMTDYLRCYTTYVNNYNNAIEILTELEENSEFAAKLKIMTDSGIKGKSLYTYLIMPIQRIPRYILLLNELIRKTKPSHPDYPHLKNAVVKMEELADYIDESKEVYNANKFVVGLQKRIKDFPKQHTLVAPNRILIKNAPLMMNQTTYWVFLFTDILVQTFPVETPVKKKKKKGAEEWPHYEFVRLLSLEGMDLFDYPDSSVAPNVFSLRSKDYSFNCSTPTKEEKLYWLCAFKESIVQF